MSRSPGPLYWTNTIFPWRVPCGFAMNTPLWILGCGDRSMSDEHLMIETTYARLFIVELREFLTVGRRRA
jgi:hypothetical protein